MSKFAMDLAERTLGSYLLAFVTLLLADHFDYTNIHILRAAGIAAIPAGLSVIKGALAKRFASDDSASFFV